MGKKSKKKNRNRRPPLSFLDKCIYWFILLLSFVFSLLLIFCFEDITTVIAFRNSSVVAYNNHASFLFVTPLLLYIEISALVFCITALDGKKPIFGNKKIQYGETPWAKDCFPLFDSRRKDFYVKPSKKRFRRDMMIVWIVGLFVCSALAPFGLFGRDCLTDNNCIISYNVLNQENSTSYTTADFSNLTIGATHVSDYRSADYWKYEITIKMKDGKTFTYSNRNFDWRKDDHRETCLEKMLEIKSFFTRDKITIKGEHNVEKVVNYLGLDDKQTILLQELFQ